MCGTAAQPPSHTHFPLFLARGLPPWLEYTPPPVRSLGHSGLQPGLGKAVRQEETPWQARLWSKALMAAFRRESGILGSVLWKMRRARPCQRQGHTTSPAVRGSRLVQFARMGVPPTFLGHDNRRQTTAGEVFHATAANRRSEALAWVLALGFAALALVGLWRGEGLTRFSAELAAFFGVIGLWISFGNWIDRRTAIEVSDAGIRSRSPLRTISFEWKDVDELWAIPSGSSWRIVVRGGSVRFGFRTSSELRGGSAPCRWDSPTASVWPV